ncbi:MAG: Lrp/AsnC family transcriptional regulator [Archaeoglobaceae archaeon]|nr:Lrp/AsnC family transcriptional regulator [Archaeoglobaceae archaeon]MDW8128402.1 Lrp/AsnC family transcriptional regulator [Archaeoglobaceae archaeon]
MDEKDLEILFTLLKNAKIPKSKIAEKLGVTETAVRKRIEKLEAQKILVGYQAILNFKKAGLFFSFTGLDVEPERLWSTLNILKEMEEIYNVYLTSGDHTILAEIVSESLEKLNEIHERISKIEGVKRVCPAIVLEVVK